MTDMRHCMIEGRECYPQVRAGAVAEAAGAVQNRDGEPGRVAVRPSP